MTPSDPKAAFEAMHAKLRYDPPQPGLKSVWIGGRAIYIDADPKVGHDELNDGSRERPFRTVARAVEEARP